MDHWKHKSDKILVPFPLGHFVQTQPILKLLQVVCKVGVNLFIEIALPFLALPCLLESFGLFWNLLDSFGFLWNLFESLGFFLNL